MFKRYFKLCPIIICVIAIMSHNVFGQNIYTNGKSEIVIDVESGRVLHQKNIHQQLPMASTTKIMTALLAIENTSLQNKIRIHPDAEGIEGSSIFLKANETIKMIDLVYGLMLRSGNDAATAIAYEVAGSVEEFAELMNKRAKQLGANNTNFVNPHGLNHDNHYTTAYDLSLITREALKNKIFKEVVKTKFWLAQRDGYQHFANKNKILNICEGGDGVKTGYTKVSGRCLVASATRKNMQFIAITLDDPNWFDNADKLLNHCFEKYQPYMVFQEGEIVKNIRVKNGDKETLPLIPCINLIIPIQDSEIGEIVSIIHAPEVILAPIMQNQQVGKIKTYLNGQLISSVDLLAGESIKVLKIKDKILNFFKIT